MQILGKRSKVLLMVIAITMLVAIGMSFAMWDMSAVKATNGDLSNYANAKVGDIVEFGRYYQTGNRIDNVENAEYEKTPIEWIVVDKDERTGQLTLMSKYILAAGSYFGNLYYNANGTWGANYQSFSPEIDGITCNQAYVESTARAFLNNLERRDLGGDSYDGTDYKTSITPSDKTTGKLLTSVGFSNKTYIFQGNSFKRPIEKDEYRKRPATRGFFDEAFTNGEKAMIVPKVISGYTGHRWPNTDNNPTEMSYIDGVVDKVWLPSATELNINAIDATNTNPSVETGSTIFEYFRNKSGEELHNALVAYGTTILKKDSRAMNYSIPVYEYQSVNINENIHATMHLLEYYWTRSPLSPSSSLICRVNNIGQFYDYNTNDSRVGIRPCVILKY